jgi:hypothetical protein
MRQKWGTSVLHAVQQSGAARTLGALLQLFEG